MRGGLLRAARSRTFRWEQRKRYDEFDYGYALTVHKAQGSQWDDVVLFDESFAFKESRAALALHRHHAGGEAAERGGVSISRCSDRHHRGSAYCAESS